MAAIDQEYASSGSSPAFLALASGGMLAVLGAVAFVPPIAETARFEHPWVSILLVLVGSALTATAHRWTFQSTVGAVSTLLDNACYSSALAFAAIHTEGTVATALAIVHAAMVLAFPAQGYGLTLFFGLAMTVPLAGMLIAFQPPLLISIVLVSTGIMTLAISTLTRRRVEMAERNRQLHKALGAAEHVAEESMQAALGTTLLSLGHFLHELRNLQTVSSTNLAFLELHAELDADCREVLAEAREVQARTTKLVTDTVSALKQRSRAENSAFDIGEVVDQIARETSGARITAVGGETPFLLQGNPEHMRAVLENLVRNAVQAGARNVRLEASLEASGQSMRLLVHDDGPGIPESQSGQLFEAFAESTKVSGTGLGLYLCRRYVGLFGGSIEAGRGPLGGAAFSIRLPGRPLVRSGAPSEASVKESVQSA